MTKLKHSKYKNSGIIFELLIRQVTADTISGKQSPALDIIKKYFLKSELSKEWITGLVGKCKVEKLKLISARADIKNFEVKLIAEGDLKIQVNKMIMVGLEPFAILAEKNMMQLEVIHL